MSVASTTAAIRFIQKSGSYNTMLTCDWGDVFQLYNEASGTTSYYPNFATMAQADKPVFTMVARNSRQTGALTFTSVKWFYNEAELFTSANSYAGLFEQVSGHSEQIRLAGNPGALAGHPSGTLRCEAVVGTDTLEASYPISVSVGADNLYIVTICSGNAANRTNHFVITSKLQTDPGYQCILAGKAFKGMQEITDTCYFRWYKADPAAAGGWTAVDGGTPVPTLTVREDEVGVYAQYKCVAYDNAACSGNPLGFDVQEVLDYSDEVAIEVAYNPVDATIVEGDPNRNSVTLTPRIVSAGDGNALPQYSSMKYNFAAYSPAGLQVGEALNASSFVVDEVMCAACGTDPKVIITTVS